MIILQTTVHTLRKFMTPSSWGKYAQAHGIRLYDDENNKLVTDTEDLAKYEVTPELKQLMARAEELDAQFKALGFTLDPM